MPYIKLASISLRSRVKQLNVSYRTRRWEAYSTP